MCGTMSSCACRVSESNCFLCQMVCRIIESRSNRLFWSVCQVGSLQLTTHSDHWSLIYTQHASSRIDCSIRVEHNQSLFISPIWQHPIVARALWSIEVYFQLQTKRVIKTKQHCIWTLWSLIKLQDKTAIQSTGTEASLNMSWLQVWKLHSVTVKS